jgi:hypothetical protein
MQKNDDEALERGVKKPVAGGPKPPAAAKPITSAGKQPMYVPPKPMMTAQERTEQKQLRRSAPVSSPALGEPAGLVKAPAAPSEALQAEITRFNDLQGKVLLTQVNDDLGDIDTAVAALSGNLENIRTRGFVFKKDFESKGESLTAQWRDLRPRAQTAVQTQTRTLQSSASGVQATLNRGAMAGTALTSLESQVAAALQNLQGMYDAFDDQVNALQRQIDDVSWTLQQAEQASYGLLPTEAPVEAVPANWKKDGDDDGVNGVLMLTDQRLLFEQKEEVATKKVLFIATEKQKLQSLAWEMPVSQIEKAEGTKRGLMGKDDFLILTCASGAAFRTAEIHLKGETGEAWQAFINRVKSGDVAQERTVPVDRAALEAVANAPTQCSNCGGVIKQTILRGQTEITCEFCGTKIRLGV